MAIDSLIAQIDAEIARLHEVRSLLAGAGKISVPAHDGRARKSSAKTGATRRKRVLSPEARKRIADAQRKRWAAQKARSK
jgi:hypothetical protein